MSDDDPNPRATIWFDTELRARVESRLGYNDALSRWMQQAARDRLIVEDTCAEVGIDLPEEPEPRRQYLRMLVKAARGAATDGATTQTDQ